MMQYLHTMLRVSNLEQSLAFFCDGLGLIETRRRDSENGRFTLVFLATAPGEPELELTWNWDPETLTGGRNFGHLAFAVDDIYATCSHLQNCGITILRPPRDGRMAFVRSPDQHSIELLQRGEAQAPQEPWQSMPNTGEW